jgi:GTP pyrophosphokinase
VVPRSTAPWCRSIRSCATGQRVEIILAKQGGPSRDWLNPSLTYLFTHRSRLKVRQWFASLALEDTLAEGTRRCHARIAAAGAGRHQPRRAGRQGSVLPAATILFIAVARAKLNMRQLQVAVRGSEMPVDERVLGRLTVHRQRDSDVAEKGILIVGIDRLLTQLAGCCKPAPPDPDRRLS